MKCQMEYLFGMLLVLVVTATLVLIASRPLGGEVREAIEGNIQLIAENFLSAVNAVIASPSPNVKYDFTVPKAKCVIKVEKNKIIVSSGDQEVIRYPIQYEMGNITADCNRTEIIRIEKKDGVIEFS